MKRIVTLGVFGFNEKDFFSKLKNENIDVFCDLRARRGMRGNKYSFVNSIQLQKRLSAMEIRYLHVKELSPGDAIRNLQKRQDKITRVVKRERQRLSEEFIVAYKRDILEKYSIADFVKRVGPNAQVVALFCVEAAPDACHRSLVAQWLREGLNIPCRDLTEKTS